MKTTSPIAMILLSGTFALCGLAGGQPAKKPDVKKPVYDEKADAKAQVELALGAATRQNRRVLIQWGRNDSDLSLQLDELFRTDRGLKKALLYEYVIVRVDAGGEKNVEVSRRYKMPAGVPSLTVLDGAGKVLASQTAEPLMIKSDDGKQAFDAKKLLEFLNAHQAEPLKADAVLEAALAEAAKSERGVFLHFGAPWCGWCLKLDAWLEQPKIAAIMGKDFVDVNIDMDRMTGAKDVFARYNTTGKGGIPWFVFLDGKGKAVATSDGPKGNIGFPFAPHEIDHFVSMLNTARRRMTADEVEALRVSLVPPAKGVPAEK